LVLQHLALENEALAIDSRLGECSYFRLQVRHHDLRAKDEFFLSQGQRRHGRPTSSSTESGYVLSCSIFTLIVIIVDIRKKSAGFPAARNLKTRDLIRLGGVNHDPDKWLPLTEL
jgi:hypothetical protein